MNNPRSTALGWGTLVAAAGISYYWAKQITNERRAKQAADGSRPTEKLDWRQRVEAASAQDAFDKAKEKTRSGEGGVKSTPSHSEETPEALGTPRSTK